MKWTALCGANALAAYVSASALPLARHFMTFAKPVHNAIV